MTTGKKKEKDKSGSKAKKLQINKLTISDLRTKDSGQVKGGVRHCDCTVTYK